MIVKGVGRAQSGNEEREVKVGDFVYFPPFTEHSITNIGEESLEFISIWWDGQPSLKETSSSNSY